MALKNAINTFEGGLNKDLNKKVLKPNSYHDARNVSISGDGDNFSIMGMEGSVQNVLLSLNEASYGKAEILAIVNCTITDKSNATTYSDLFEYTPGVVYIIKQENNTPATGGKIKVVMHAPNLSSFAQVVYEEIYDLSIILEHPNKTSAFVFGENNQDYIYFTDSERFIRKIPCVVDSSKTYQTSAHAQSAGKLVLDFGGMDLTDRFKTGDSIFVNFTDVYTDGFYAITNSEHLVSTTSIYLDLPYVSVPSGPSIITFSGPKNPDRSTRVIPASIPALNTLSLLASSGGNLLAGTYIAYIRLIDENNNKSSDWSAATNIEDVFNSIPGGKEGTIGTITDNKLRIRFVMSQEMLDNYTSIQYALVERTSGLTTYQTATLGTPISISNGIDGANFDITINTNRPSSLISISDIVIDDASIETAEAITTKNNRLIAGGVKYKSLVFDHPSGLPAIDNTLTTIFEDVAGGIKRGYFRDEVYRFGIVYFNEDGVYGNVATLDMSSVAVNSASSGVDFKFPKRVDGGKWAIISSATQNPKALGINFGAITNHPTWAKGFEIVRVQRRKNIQFQTPMIPTMYIGPVQATNNYPVSAIEGITTPVDVAYDATPALPKGSFTIKNFFRPWNKNIADDNSGLLDGAGYGSIGSDQKAHFAFLVFDPAHLYGSGSQYRFNNGDSIGVVDMAILTSNVEFYSGPPIVTDGKNNHGNYVDTEAHYTGFAQSADDYYVYGTGTTAITFDFLNSNGSSLADAKESSSILDYQTMENLGIGVEMATTAGVPSLTGGSILGTNKIGSFVDLQATGLTEGITPNVNKASAIITKDRMPDATHWSATSTSGVNFYANHSYGPAFATIPNTYITEPASNADKNDFLTNNAAKTNAISIANVTIGLEDDRYGKIKEVYEFISTGSKYTFSAAELTSTGGGGVEGGKIVPVAVNGVLGGDCIISQHEYKISDGVYGMAATEKLAATNVTVNNDIRRWDRSFSGGNASAPSDTLIGRPVPYKAVSQTITIFIESEVNAGIQDLAIYNPQSAGLSYRYPLGASELKTPFLYDYSSDFSLGQDGKVFFPQDYTSKELSEFPSRILYSNQKIYQSFEEGFDRFPVLNFYDLEERYGDIANLHVFKDRVFAFQENAISYIPIGKNVVETADGIALSLQTGQIIGTPLFMSTYLGSTVGTNIISNNNIIFAIDQKRGSIIAFDGSSVEDLSSRGMETFFRGSKYTDMSYDYSRKELIVYDRHSTAIDAGTDDNLKFRPVIFSDKTKAWVSEIDGVSGDFVGINWQSPREIVVGETVPKNGLLAMAAVSGSDNVTVHDMYENKTFTEILSTFQSPYIHYTVNNDILNSKTFDVMSFYSDKKLNNATITTYRQNVSYSAVMVLPTTTREGIYRVKALRDATTGRLRGTFADVKVDWSIGNLAKLSHTVMKYRVSNRAINKEK